MRRMTCGLIVLLLSASPALGISLQTPTISLFIGPKDEALAVVPDLEKQLGLSRRFVVMPASAAVGIPQALEPAISRLKKSTKADFALVGTLTSRDKTLKMEGRVYDLVLNDVSKVLRFEGGSDDVPLLTSQLLSFLKSRHPLKGEVLGMQDELVLLNVGAEDGVDAGSFYDVVPALGNDPKPFGRVRILKTEAWFSTATTLSIKKGTHFKPGDVAIEDVAVQHLLP